MNLLRSVLVAACVLLPILGGLGGCAQHVTVHGSPDQLYAEAKGALESEGFQTMQCKNHMFGSKGSSMSEGRLQFLYYSDTVAATVVQVSIVPNPEEVAPAATNSHNVEVSAWSSLTYAPDPWITDLAMGSLRRAFLLSGNIR